MTDAAVAISSVRKTFAGASQPALGGVSLDILKNEFFTLLGPSGCGKTTLLRMIAGFENPDSGAILLDGTAMARTPPNRRPVNTVFQSYALFPHMSVAQNIAFALEMLGRPRDAIRARVAEMMRLLRLDGLGDRRPAQLSGGQQQRVALGRALAPEPKVLLLDEPLSALDLKLRKEMQIELKRLQTETGITFVFVTHDQEEALTMSDRVAVMRGGAVMQIGRPADIYERPANLFVAEFIGEANLLPAICVDRTGHGGTFRLAGASDDDGAIAVADAGTLAPGQTATLVVRPERVALVPAQTTRLRGQAREAVYRGSDLMLHATLPGGAMLRARLPGDADATALIGQVTGFAFPSDAVRAFAA
ncbi:ABC transporter ATP-binding protein [Bosea sp. 2KB_26]|uniref:ABC transporter ATP-binding protein n=1 Tax=Bosea sp. 2KB_26 TaxID=3237475 RepID=UPI003F902EFB